MEVPWIVSWNRSFTGWNPDVVGAVFRNFVVQHKKSVPFQSFLLQSLKNTKLEQNIPILFSFLDTRRGFQLLTSDYNSLDKRGMEWTLHDHCKLSCFAQYYHASYVWCYFWQNQDVTNRNVTGIKQRKTRTKWGVKRLRTRTKITVTCKLHQLHTIHVQQEIISWCKWNWPPDWRNVSWHTNLTTIGIVLPRKFISICDWQHALISRK